MGEWPLVALAEVASRIPNAMVGGPFGSNLVSSDYVAQGVPVIRGQNMGPGRWVGGDFVYVTESKARALQSNIARPGDVVFTQRGTLGQVAVVPSGPYDRYVVSQSQMKITVDPTKISSAYLYYFFTSAGGREYIRQNAIQTGVPHTNLGILRRTPIPLPPLPIQLYIAEILGDLDDKIDLNTRMNATLEAIARAVFKSWFVNFDLVRAKAEGRDPCLPKSIADLLPSRLVDSELGKIPEGWEVLPVYDLATYVNGAAYKAFQPNDDRRGLPIIKIAELKAGVTSQTKYSEVEMPDKYRLRTGDILFSWSGNPDTSIDTFVWAHGPAWLNQHIFRVEPRSSGARSFVLATLKCLRPVFAEIARNKQTTGLGHVTVGDLQRLLVVMPDAQALAAWTGAATPLFDSVFNNEQEALTLARLRDALLPKLLSGEVSPSDAAPATA